MKKYDYLVYIGRFQPCHSGHVYVLEQALRLAEKVIVLVGSTNQPRTIKNPWTFEERKDMILSSLPYTANVVVLSNRDRVYNDQQWVRDVQELVDSTIMEHNAVMPCNKSVGVIGHSKDESSFYLKLFPQWETVEVANFDSINATDIRELMFSGEHQKRFPTVPPAVESFINKFMTTAAYKTLVEEYLFINKYKKAWASAPYPPTFVTVDSCVIQAGHVLMIKRRAAPGAGLLALPGGFINQNEKIEDACIRELREETKIKVPDPVLRGCIRSQKVFDAPNRSLRGRTITHAYLIELPPGDLPKVKGSDDAIKAQWIPLNEVDESKCFEDHYAIIQYFLGRI